MLDEGQTQRYQAASSEIRGPFGLCRVRTSFVNLAPGVPKTLVLPLVSKGRCMIKLAKSKHLKQQTKAFMITANRLYSLYSIGDITECVRAVSAMAKLIIRVVAKTRTGSGSKPVRIVSAVCSRRVLGTYYAAWAQSCARDDITIISRSAYVMLTLTHLKVFR